MTCDSKECHRSRNSSCHKKSEVEESVPMRYKCEYKLGRGFAQPCSCLGLMSYMSPFHLLSTMGRSEAVGTTRTTGSSALLMHGQTHCDAHFVDHCIFPSELLLQ